MKSIIKHNIAGYICDRRKIVIFIIFSFFCGSEIRTASLTEMSIFEYILFIISNHYYIIYFMLMSYIFFSFDSMHEDHSLLFIRIKSIGNMYMCRIVSILIQTIIFVGAHIVIIFVIGMFNFKIINKFTAVSISGYYSDILRFIFEYDRYFKNPVMACIVTVAFMIIGLSFISTIIYIIYNTIGKKACFVAIAIIILNIMIGFKNGVSGIAEIFFLNNYFVFHHVLFMSDWIFVVINLFIEICVIICGYYILKKKNGNNSSIQRYSYMHGIFRNVYIYSGLFIIIYIILNIGSVFVIEGKITSTDLLLINLSGYLIENFDFTEFLRYVIFFMIPVFFVGVMIEKQNNLYSSQVAIRYGNKKIWDKLLEKNINRYVIGFVLCFMIVMVLLSFMIGVINNEKSMYVSDFIKYMKIKQSVLYYTLIISAGLKFLEMYYYKNLFLLWRSVTKNNIAAYIITFFGFILGFIMPHSLFVSYGCSSVYYLISLLSENGIGTTVIFISVIIIIKIALVKMIQVIYLKK